MHHVRGTSFERALSIFRSASSAFVNSVARRGDGRDWSGALCLALLLHAGAARDVGETGANYFANRPSSGNPVIGWGRNAGL